MPEEENTNETQNGLGRTERQRLRSRLTAAGAPEQEVETAVAQIPGEPVTSDQMETRDDDAEFEEPAPPTVTGAQQFELGETEQQVQSLIEETNELQGELTEKEQFRGQKEEELGIPELRRTRQDLQNRLQQIKTEEEQIPLRIQQEFEGRGVTKGGIEPIETGRLRENAIRSLTVSSLLEANKGNISTALDQVDRAVEQRFGPIEAEINANIKNLERLQNSPQATVEEKRRAQKRKRSQQRRKRRIEEQKEEEKDIREIAVNAAKQGVSSENLNRILAADNVTEAQRMATEVAPKEENTFTTQEVGGQLIEFETNPQGQVVGQRVVRGGETGGEAEGTTTGGEATEGDDEEELTRDEAFSQAEQFVQDNKNASRQEVEAALQKRVGDVLNNSEIDSLIDKVGIVEREATFNDQQLQSIAQSLVSGSRPSEPGFFDSIGNFFTGGEMSEEERTQKAKENAKEKIRNAGKVKLGGNTISLTPAQIEKIINEIDRQ